jgi:glutamyl-tRNA reductase
VIVVVGMSHRTAPIEVRERLALGPEALPEVLRGLVADGPIGEALVISTCNRVEFLVAGGDGPRADLERLAEAATERVLSRAPGLAGHLYRHVGADAVAHLFRVAASLDSLVVGEPQILGQLKDAYDLAREVGTAGPVLNRAVPRAIRAAKRVRSETTIGVGQVSVPSVAVDLARQIFGDLGGHTAALVGSGEMGEAVAKLVRQAGAKLVVVGRNTARVSEIAASLDATPRSFAELDKTLVEADVVITTTSAPGFVIDAPTVRAQRKARKGRTLFFIDLAVPRDVDPEVNRLDGVFLYNVDDLSKVVAESLEGRRREAERAEEIVREEAENFGRWVEAEQVTPTIVALRERFRTVLTAEVERSFGGKLRHLAPPDREALSVMIEASLNKMLHRATARLRRMAVDPAARADLELAVSAIHDLFELADAGLGADPPAPVPASDPAGGGSASAAGEPPSDGQGEGAGPPGRHSRVARTG